LLYRQLIGQEPLKRPNAQRQVGLTAAHSPNMREIAAIIVDSRRGRPTRPEHEVDGV
jgi:hypothetical protein